MTVTELHPQPEVHPKKKLKSEKKLTPRIRSRNYCFTDFNDTKFEQIYYANESIIRYMCWGLEVCPKTKKTHQQGWIQMVNPKDFHVIRKLLGGKCHLEKCMGSEYSNDKYCKKDGEYVQKGSFKSQGYRSDLEDIKKSIDDGAPMKSIADDYFGDYIRYYKGFEKYQEMVTKEKTKEFRQVDVIVHQGETGTGKTRVAVESERDHYMIRGDDLTWFDGYNGEKTLIIDEYANQVPVTKLLSLLDGYQLRLPVKGGFTYAAWNKVYITTNLTWLHDQAREEHIAALERRVTKVVNFDTKCQEG